MECELELPWPPSVNHYKNIGRTVRTKSGKTYQQRVNSPETKMFYFRVWQKIRAAMALKPNWSGLESTIRYEVTVMLHPPHNRRYDVDNRLKVLLDSFVRGGLIKDDAQITRLVVEKMSMIPEGKVIVRIKELQCT